MLKLRSARAEADGYLRNTIPVPNVVSRLGPAIRLERGLGYFLILGIFFDGHVFELAGLEDFTTFETLYEFRILVTGDDLHARVLAFIHCCFAQG
jgi:hypothetical protein